jgi:5-methylthioribose kinase
MGFDVGAIIGNLLLAYYAQEGHEPKVYGRNAYRHWILMQAEQVWRLFQKRFVELWDKSKSGDAYMPELFQESTGVAVFADEKQRFMRTLFVDTISFAGIKMIRRILGLAHTEDLETIENLALRARCETKALKLARRLVIDAERLNGMGDVISAARAIHASPN